MSAENVINAAAIERLRKLGGDGFTLKMMDLFISYCGEKVAAARQAAKAGDLTAVAEAAHPIKSSAGNVGATRVQEFAAGLEQAARQGDSGKVAALLPRLEAAYAEAKSGLEAERARLKPPAN